MIDYDRLVILALQLLHGALIGTACGLMAGRGAQRRGSRCVLHTKGSMMNVHNVIDFVVGFTVPFALVWFVFVYRFGNVSLKPLAFGVGAGIIAIVAILTAFRVAWPKD